MAATPLIMGATQLRLLADLRERAAKVPVSMDGLLERLKDPDAKAAHMARMDDLTVTIPIEFLVTFSIETGHPIGTCRHMSMSSPRKGRLPSIEAVQWVAEALGFIGRIDDGTCHVWIEDLARGHARAQAVNVVQPVSVVATSGAA